MNQNNFNVDLQNEQVLAVYLDQFYYNQYEGDFERVQELNRQLAGIDMVYNHNDVEMLIDEKGYLSRPTIQNTFVLELSYLHNGNRMEGWLFSQAKETTHYLLCWADRDNINIYQQPLNVNHIHQVEAMLVNRANLIAYLNNRYGINQEYIMNNHENLLMRTQNGPLYLEDSTSKYVLSKQLREQPLNIVMTKNEYLESGAVEMRTLITREGILNLL